MEYRGKKVSDGIAIGKIFVYHKWDEAAHRKASGDAETEIARFVMAGEIAEKQLKALYEKAKAEAGEESAAIFQAHLTLISDKELRKHVEDLIRDKGICAEEAIAEDGDHYLKMLVSSEDELLRSRGADIKDVSRRLIRILKGEDGHGNLPGDPVILFAEELLPSELMQLGSSRVLSVVTRYGSPYSHTSILARAMHIPVLTGVELPRDADGRTAVVDGNEGILLLDPDERQLSEYAKKQEEDGRQEKAYRELIGKKSVTLDGKELPVYANIGSVSEVSEVLSCDAEGIGLLRSEFLFSEASDYPGEEEQYRIYKEVAEEMGGRQLVIRTLDIGADKQANYFHIREEDNPMMGYRGIRVSLDRPDIFKPQLRAIYRAACFGQISVLFPMISSLEEVYRIKEILKEVKDELTAEKIPFKEVGLGLMIETPAAVMMAEELAREVDFFSIGSNDLTQYTLAVDRQNGALEKTYRPHHPAVLKMIRTTVENGHKGGVQVGICGELAGDPTMTETFLRMGVDALSVSPSKVLMLRDVIRRIDLRKD